MTGVDVRSRITECIEDFLHGFDGVLFDVTVNMIKTAIAPKIDNFRNVNRQHKQFIKDEASRLVKEAVARLEAPPVIAPLQNETPRLDGGAALQPERELPSESTPSVARAPATNPQEASPLQAAAPAHPVVRENVATAAAGAPPTAPAPVQAAAPATAAPAAPPTTTAPAQIPVVQASSSTSAAQQGKQKRARSIPQTTEELCEWLQEMFEMTTFSKVAMDVRQSFLKNVQEQAIDAESVLCLSDDDLKDLGLLLMGPRRIVLRAIKDTFGKPPPTPADTRMPTETSQFSETTPRLNLETAFAPGQAQGQQSPQGGDEQSAQAGLTGAQAGHVSTPPGGSKDAAATAKHADQMDEEVVDQGNFVETARKIAGIVKSGSGLDSNRTEALTPLLLGVKDARLLRCFETWSGGQFVGAPDWSAVTARLDGLQTELNVEEAAGALGPAPMEVDAQAPASNAAQGAQGDSSGAGDASGGAQAAQGSGSGSVGAGAAAPVDAEQAEREAQESERDVLKMSEKVKEQMLTEEFCVNACQWAVRKSTQVFTGLNHTRWASDSVKQAKITELQGLANMMALPASSFVTFGDTGAGKSTLLNALIGEANILPTNGMRACTATIIELSHNKEASGPNYVGEAEFVTLEEWSKELDTLVDDLTQQDGRCIIMEPDPKAPNYQAYCKLNAIYGIDYRNSYTNDVLPSGQRARRNLMAPQLKAKLMRHHVSRYLGTTQREQSDEPARFRKLLEKYMETPNSIEGSQLWPLVKRVRIRGRNWKVLESGAILVDAPGVNDDNSARDKVVKDYLKKADGVWIVANMKRACNNKTAKDMLGQSFRRQLLMDGQYGSLAFIATQSDEFQRSDVIRSIGLHPDSTTEQCAMARKEWVRTRVQDDFYDGLEEMQRQAGERVDAEEIRKKYQLPVFCVSAVDFQILSGVRSADGAARAFRHSFGTEVPKLQQFVHETTLKRRYTNVRRVAEQLVNYYKGLEAMLEETGKVDPTTSVQRKRVTMMAVAALTRDVHSHTVEFDKYLNSAFSKDLAPLLNQGAKQAEGDCMATVEGWTKMHWATYKATTRRHGVFRTNWNEELAEAVFQHASMQWERALVSTLGEKLDGVKERCIESVRKAHHTIAQALNADAARIASIRQPQEQAASLQLSSLTDVVMSLAQNQQRELSRSVAPHIQEVMGPGYDAGAAEKGGGSHARRKAIVQDHCRANRKAMFADATGNIAQDLDKLRKEIKQVLNTNVTQLGSHITVAYESFWSHDNSAEAKQSRRALLDALQSSKFEAESNLKKLLVAHGDWEGDEDEDEVQAVDTQGDVEVIDLCSDSEEPYVPPPQASMPARIGVKLEKGLSSNKREPAIVVVMGATGAGKSTLINAVLGEIDLLPTNSMRACTATIIEIAHKPPGGKRYAAQVVFLSKAEWEAQVTWLIHSIQAPGAAGGGSAISIPEEDTPAHEVYCKVRAAYGSGVDLAAGPSRLFAAAKDGAVAKALGTSVRVEADTARELLQLYGPYVDSTNETADESVWPIVKTVRLEGPFDVLDGVTLVDSPGLGDDDSARNAAVKHFLGRADAVWLAGNIKRAVNDKLIKDMMPAALRRQVVRSGVTGSLCVIATQSDDAVASELISNLALPEHASKLDTILARNKFVKERLVKDFFAGTGKVPKQPSARKPNRFQLQTFTASATEFQKLSKVRNEDGDAQTFADVAQTDIPALRAQIRATASLAAPGAHGPKLGRLLLQCKEKADAAARGEGDEMDEDEGYGNDSGSDNDVPPPAPPGARPAIPVLGPGEKVVKCQCGTALKVKTSARSHCPRCYAVFAPSAPVAPLVSAPPARGNRLPSMVTPAGIPARAGARAGGAAGGAQLSNAQTLALQKAQALAFQQRLQRVEAADRQRVQAAKQAAAQRRR